MPPSVPILFPSGEDANPLRRRLPAEVVTRKRREIKPVEEKVSDDVRVDLKTAILLKPDARPKWLSKACKMAEEGKASKTELYSIITSRKFIGGLPTKIGRRLREIVLESASLFSDKQQRHLRSEEWPLNAQYGERPDGELDGRGDDDGDVDRSADEKASEERPRRRKEEERPAELKRPGKVEEAGDDGESWTAVPAARGQQERVHREAALAEERARRKQREQEEQERWMEAQAEASKKKSQEQQELKKRQLEDEVDSSLMLLDSLGGSGSSAPAPPPPPSRRSRADEDSDRDRGGRRGRGGLSRSRSIRVRSRSRRRRRSRSKGGGGGRRRRSGSRSKVDFAEALRRRLEEREASDTTRMAVVDPGHAARWAQRTW